MVEILVGQVASFETGGSEAGVVSRTRMPTHDRRKRKADRRRSVREGIFVSLSMKNERRVHRDRRKGT